MRSFARTAAVAVIALAAGTASAMAACNGDTGTETVLGAASGATVGGLASHSVAGAAIGGIAGGLIGNAIGSSNNREDCRREAYYYDRDRYAYEAPPVVAYSRPPDSYVDRYGEVHYYSDYPDD
jgi:branched-subunit amino acid ABC-type transport system permease component